MNTNLLIVLLIWFVFASCTEDPKPAVENPKNESVQNQLPTLSDEYLTRLFELQEMIRIFPEDRDFRQEYIEHCYLKDKGLFISLGFGTLHDPQSGNPIMEQYYRRAARIDAARWAAYGKSWLTNELEPPFGKLETTQIMTGQELRTTVLGDSLFLFMATPMQITN